MLKSWSRRFEKFNPDGSYSSFYLYSKLFHYIRPYLWRAVIAVLITIPIGSLDAAIAFSLKPFMDGMISKESMDSVAQVPFIIVGFTALQGLLSYFSIYLNGWLGFYIVRDIRRDLFKKLNDMEISYFDTSTAGGIIYRYFNDPGTLQKSVLESLKQFLTRLFSTFSLAAVLIATSWKLAIVAIFITLFILYPSTRLNKIIKSMNDKMVGTSTDMLSLYNETVLGIRVVKGYNMQKQREKAFNELQKMLFAFSMKLIKTQGWLTPSMHLIASIGIAIIIWSGSQMVMTGELTPGGFISFLTALIMMYNPIKNLGNTFLSTLTSLHAAGRVCEILDLEPKLVDKPDAIELTDFKESISFNDVTFEYISEQTVLRNVNLQFKRGETVAIVGNSGGGKSTIVSLIPRFYDVLHGSITIDGHDIRDITMDSLRNQISLVLQDNFLFNGTIKENLLVGNPHAADEQILEVLDKAYLTEFVESMPYHYNTPIGERGVMLSGGQRQRVAIARALLKDAPIVILDEATSALDNKSEAIVQQAMESLMENRTVIIIAHRLSTIRNADRVVVMDEGRVAEEGTHEELLALDGIYAHLYRTQFKTQDTSSSEESLQPENSDVPASEPPATEALV